MCVRIPHNCEHIAKGIISRLYPWNLDRKHCTMSPTEFLEPNIHPTAILYFTVFFCGIYIILRTHECCAHVLLTFSLFLRMSLEKKLVINELQHHEKTIDPSADQGCQKHFEMVSGTTECFFLIHFSCCLLSLSSLSCLSLMVCAEHIVIEFMAVSRGLYLFLWL